MNKNNFKEIIDKVVLDLEINSTPLFYNMSQIDKNIDNNNNNNNNNMLYYYRK